MTQLETIRAHHALCDEIHQCVLEENRFLRQHQRAPDAAFLERKRALLEKLDRTLAAGRKMMNDLLEPLDRGDLLPGELVRSVATSLDEVPGHAEPAEAAP